jgi:hypothetical protein
MIHYIKIKELNCAYNLTQATVFSQQIYLYNCILFRLILRLLCIHVSRGTHI